MSTERATSASLAGKGVALPRYFVLDGRVFVKQFMERPSLARWRALPIVLLLVVTTAACDSAVDPIASSDMAFSIYGHLDAAADTQWIRVAPFRSSIFSTPEPVDAVVSIEEMETGRRIQLVPTPFTQRSGNFNDTLYASNFRTTEPINPGTTYVLTALRSDGRTSSSVALTPPDFRSYPITVGSSRDSSVPSYVRFYVPAGAHVAMVQTVMYLREFDAPAPFEGDACPIGLRYNSLPSQPPPPGGGEYQVNIRPVENIITDINGEGRAPCVTAGFAIRMVLSGEEWPFDPGFDVSHINAINTVQNGVGFLGGVISKEIDWEWCSNSGSNSPIFCEVVHNVETATLNVAAANGSPPGSTATFNPTTRLHLGSNTWGRLGTIISPPEAESRIVRFQKILPGTYRLRLEVPSNANPTPFYCEERTVILTPGERHIEVVMVPRSAFPNEPVNANGCREG